MYVLIHLILTFFFLNVCYASSDESLDNYETLKIKYSNGARELFPALEKLEENLSGKASKELERLILYISKNQNINIDKAEKLLYEFIIKKKTIETRNGIFNISNSNEEDELARLIDEFSKTIALKLLGEFEYVKGHFHESDYYKHFCLRYVLQHFFNEFDIKTHFLKGNELKNLETIKKKNFINNTFTPQIDTRYIIGILDQTFSKEGSLYKSSFEAEEIDVISISSEERINPIIPNSDKGPIATTNVKNKNKEPKEPTVNNITFNYMPTVFFITPYAFSPNPQYFWTFNNHKGQQ